MSVVQAYLSLMQGFMFKLIKLSKYGRYKFLKRSQKRFFKICNWKQARKSITRTFNKHRKNCLIQQNTTQNSIVPHISLKVKFLGSQIWQTSQKFTKIYSYHNSDISRFDLNYTLINYLNGDIFYYPMNHVSRPFSILDKKSGMDDGVSRNGLYSTYMFRIQETVYSKLHTRDYYEVCQAEDEQELWYHPHQLKVRVFEWTRERLKPKRYRKIFEFRELLYSMHPVFDEAGSARYDLTRERYNWFKNAEPWQPQTQLWEDYPAWIQTLYIKYAIQFTEGFIETFPWDDEILYADEEDLRWILDTWGNFYKAGVFNHYELVRLSDIHGMELLEEVDGMWLLRRIFWDKIIAEYIYKERYLAFLDPSINLEVGLTFKNPVFDWTTIANWQHKIYFNENVVPENSIIEWNQKSSLEKLVLLKKNFLETSLNFFKQPQFAFPKNRFPRSSNFTNNNIRDIIGFNSNSVRGSSWGFSKEFTRFAYRFKSIAFLTRRTEYLAEDAVESRDYDDWIQVFKRAVKVEDLWYLPNGETYIKNSFQIWVFSRLAFFCQEVLPQKWQDNCHLKVIFDGNCLYMRLELIFLTKSLGVMPDIAYKTYLVNSWNVLIKDVVLLNYELEAVKNLQKPYLYTLTNWKILTKKGIFSSLFFNILQEICLYITMSIFLTDILFKDLWCILVNNLHFFKEFRFKSIEDFKEQHREFMLAFFKYMLYIAPKVFARLGEYFDDMLVKYVEFCIYILNPSLKKHALLDEMKILNLKRKYKVLNKISLKCPNNLYIQLQPIEYNIIKSTKRFQLPIFVDAEHYIYQKYPKVTILNENCVYIRYISPLGKKHDFEMTYANYIDYRTWYEMANLPPKPSKLGFNLRALQKDFFMTETDSGGRIGANKNRADIQGNEMEEFDLTLRQQKDVIFFDDKLDSFFEIATPKQLFYFWLDRTVFIIFAILWAGFFIQMLIDTFAIPSYFEQINLFFRKKPVTYMYSDWDLSAEDLYKFRPFDSWRKYMPWFETSFDAKIVEARIKKIGNSAQIMLEKAEALKLQVARDKFEALYLDKTNLKLSLKKAEDLVYKYIVDVEKACINSAIENQLETPFTEFNLKRNIRNFLYNVQNMLERVSHVIPKFISKYFPTINWDYRPMYFEVKHPEAEIPNKIFETKVVDLDAKLLLDYSKKFPDIKVVEHVLKITPEAALQNVCPNYRDEYKRFLDKESQSLSSEIHLKKNIRNMFHNYQNALEYISHYIPKVVSNSKYCPRINWDYYPMYFNTKLPLELERALNIPYEHAFFFESHNININSKLFEIKDVCLSQTSLKNNDIRQLPIAWNNEHLHAINNESFKVFHAEFLELCLNPDFIAISSAEEIEAYFKQAEVERCGLLGTHHLLNELLDDLLEEAGYAELYPKFLNVEFLTKRSEKG